MEKPKRIKSPMEDERVIQRRIAAGHPSKDLLSTVDGILNEISARKNVFPNTYLRKVAFSLGLLETISPTAEYVVNVGCAAPFMSPDVLRSYFRVLDKFGVDFTVLDDEVCCGWLALESAVLKGDSETIKKAEQACRGFIKENVEHARAKGARNMLHFCEWCVYIYNWARDERALGEEGQKVGQLTLLAPIFDRLDKVKLRLEKPAVIGYYQGCYRRSGAIVPGVKLDWSPYRQVLDRIENAEIVDLPNVCCYAGREKIIEDAKRKKIDIVVTRCYPCWIHLHLASKGTVPVKFISQMLDDVSLEK